MTIENLEIKIFYTIEKQPNKILENKEDMDKRNA